MKFLRKKILLWTGIIVIVLLFLGSSSCTLYKIAHFDNYEDFAEISNTIWTNLYFKIKDIKIPNYDRLIYKDTTWTKAEGPVVVEGNMYILPGVNLTIRPGTKVMLGDDTLVTCRGVIHAKGTEQEPVIFTRKKAGEHWLNIKCSNCIGSKKGKQGRVIFDHCIVEHGQGLVVNSARGRVTNCEFRNNVSTSLKFEYAAGFIANNHVHDNTTKPQTQSGNGAGINVYTDKTVRIEDNRVHDNVSHGGRDGGGGIYAFAYNKGKVTVSGNKVTDNLSDRKAGGIFAYSAQVVNNKIFNNKADKQGGGICSINSVLKDNVITGNRSTEGGGVYAENSDLFHNLVKNNTAADGCGLFSVGSGTIRHNTICENSGLRPEHSAAIVLSGNSLVEKNNIAAPAGYALRFQSHSLCSDLKAHHNYWGTSDPDIIEALIFDWVEDSEVGLVAWKKYKESPVAKAYPVEDRDTLKTPKTLQKAKADTIRGVIEEDTVVGDGTIQKYTVTGNVLLRKNASLRIMPGTELFLEKDVTLRVRGYLGAKGEKETPIRFVGKKESRWGRMLFESRSAGRKKAGGDDRQSKLSHCLIENGGGLVMDGKGADLIDCEVGGHGNTGLRIKKAPARIENCRIHDNVSDSDGGGIYIYGSRQVFVHDNRIENNTAADGGGVFAYGYRSNTAVDIRDNLVKNNISRGDGGGMWVTRSAVVDNTITGNRTDAKGGGLYASFALINDNRIGQNEADKGGGIYAEANSTFLNNRVIGNTCRTNLGGGVFLNYWGLSMHNKEFAGNIVKNNTATGEKAVGGVYIKGDLKFKNNVLRDNSGIQLYNENSPDNGNITAAHCFWGTTDKDRIEQYIYHGRDDAGLSTVKFKPIARTKEEALSMEEEASGE